MLFSEPKIPHAPPTRRGVRSGRRFSALQRAENSSFSISRSKGTLFRAFQCSSASRKFLTRLSRASLRRRRAAFQCSSASRKFLTLRTSRNLDERAERFSALQRAENSSFPSAAGVRRLSTRVSVLFSEPKIPQPTLAPASIHISDRDDHASSFLSLPGASP